MTQAIRASNWADLGRWLRRRYRRFRVAGHSMAPTIMAGQEVFYDPVAYQRLPPRTGDIVVARHPYENLVLIKRITDILPDGRLVLKGDNRRHSSDSREFGPLPADAILGKVICTFP